MDMSVCGSEARVRVCVLAGRPFLQHAYDPLISQPLSLIACCILTQGSQSAPTTQSLGDSAWACMGWLMAGRGCCQDTDDPEPNNCT